MCDRLHLGDAHRMLDQQSHEQSLRRQSGGQTLYDINEHTERQAAGLGLFIRANEFAATVCLR